MNSRSQDFRKRMRARRRQLSMAQQRKHGQAVCKHLTRGHEGRFRRKAIGIYQDFDGELATTRLIKQLRRCGARLYVPIIRPSGISFAPLLLCAQQTLNSFNILEPKVLNARITPQQIDLLLTPLTTFDRQGNRVGMGAGYYDRCFAFKRYAPAKKPLMVGMAHSCQEVGYGLLEQQAWDVPLDYMATEKGLRKCLHRGR